ncbi:MAG: site-specific DNA-methyltransferase [Desulfamplus sp.]|nr:site-specific DNA-methyltransferase [Desulfamplus sp.]
MKTKHQFLFQDSRCLSDIKSDTIDLTVTSPPYPMIEMWDNLFIEQNSQISDELNKDDGKSAFELMHKELDKVWQEVLRVTKSGGWVAINIGDATRKIGNYFQLYSNHTRITSKFITMGFDVLPLILWKKTTNAPNKFMGSGMLPSGAYVTLEHEYILLFRKGHRREFKTAEEKYNRNVSAFFWEERNRWFSDNWDLKGVYQNLFNCKTRERSAAFPFELPYRIINMYSVKGDIVLDPFVGTGTTSLASAILQRNSIGLEIDSNFKDIIFSKFNEIPNKSYELAKSRIDNHLSFIKEYIGKKGGTKHNNNNYNFPVVTKQEKNLLISYINNIEFNSNSFLTSHCEYNLKAENLKTENEFVFFNEQKQPQQISLF